MNLASLYIAELVGFALAAARIAGFVLVSPFPGKHVPNKIKIGLILMLAFVVRSMASPVRSLAIEYVPAELGIGLVIGFTVRLTFSAVEMLGANVAQATGLTMAQVYDPTTGGEDPVPARIVSMFGMLIFLGIGAHRVALGYVLASFQALPIGQVTEIGAVAPSFVTFLSEAMDVGLRLSLPVVAVGLAVQITLALVSRASPSLQVFNIGMGVTVAACLLVALATIDDSWRPGIAAELTHEAPRIEQVLRP